MTANFSRGGIYLGPSPCMVETWCATSEEPVEVTLRIERAQFAKHDESLLEEKTMNFHRLTALRKG